MVRSFGLAGWAGSSRTPRPPTPRPSPSRPPTAARPAASSTYRCPTRTGGSSRHNGQLQLQADSRNTSAALQADPSETDDLVRLLTEIIPARRGHAAFSTASESRGLKWPFQPHFSFPEDTAGVAAPSLASVAIPNGSTLTLSVLFVCRPTSSQPSGISCSDGWRPSPRRSSRRTAGRRTAPHSLPSLIQLIAHSVLDILNGVGRFTAFCPRSLNSSNARHRLSSTAWLDSPCPVAATGWRTRTAASRCVSPPWPFSTAAAH